MPPRTKPPTPPEAGAQVRRSAFRTTAAPAPSARRESEVGRVAEAVEKPLAHSLVLVLAAVPCDHLRYHRLLQRAGVAKPGLWPLFAATQVPADASVDIISAPHTTTQNHAGVSVLSILETSAFERRAIRPNYSRCARTPSLSNRGRAILSLGGVYSASSLVAPPGDSFPGLRGSRLQQGIGDSSLPPPPHTGLRYRPRRHPVSTTTAPAAIPSTRNCAASERTAAIGPEQSTPRSLSSCPPRHCRHPRR
jgi:hypothetical protein